MHPTSSRVWYNDIARQMMNILRRAIPSVQEVHMFYALSLLAGMMISVMVVFNGGLNAQVGFGLSLVLIHIAGLITIALVMLIKREKPVFPKMPPFWYTAGLLGILTTVFNLLAFGHISVSAMMALGLLGESMSSLFADHTGLLGIPVRKMRREKVAGLVLILAGIVIMMTDFVLVPVLVSFMAGITVLLSRIINGGLSRKSSVTSATLINYLTGLLGAIVAAAFIGVPTPISTQGPITNYLGGAVGAVIVIISNFVVGKIASFYMTLTLFVGQVSAGLLLDMMLQGFFPVRIALGGLCVLLGLTLNLLQDRAYALKTGREF